MARLPLVIGVLFLVIVACRPSSSARYRIGLIPWGNVNKKVLEAALPDSFTVITVPTGRGKSPYERVKIIYSFLESRNLLALVGPYKEEVGLAAESQRLPYLSVTDLTSETRDYTLELSPDMADIGKAVHDVVHFYSWSKISVFYDDDRGVPLLENLMTNHTMTVRGWRLPRLAQDGQVKRYLVEMRKVQAETSVVLCNRDNTRKILEQARQLAMLSTPPYQWIFYDPGLEATDLLLSFSDVPVNFTVLSRLPLSPISSTPPGLSRLDHYYVMEAADVLMSVHHDFRNKSAGGAGNGAREKDDFRKKLFDIQGHRKDFTLYLMKLSGDLQLKEFGKWRSRLELYQNMNTVKLDLDHTARVVMIEDPPFTMKRVDFSSRKGNDRFEGFAVDLLEEIAKMLKFDYEIYLVHDGKFGSKQSDGQWNGMIGELLAGNATMSVAPMSINSEREEAVDFTKPFMTRYINVVMRVPRRKTLHFEFLKALSLHVWISVLLAFLVVSVVLYVLEKPLTCCFSASSRCSASPSSPREGWRHRDPPHTMRESFFVIIGTVLQGSTDFTPGTVAGRILISSWMFFALILTSSYTANLAAFLTVKQINTPIWSVMDLAKQTHIKYGTVKSSGVVAFFKNTKDDKYAKMWAQMSVTDHDSMLENTSVAFTKVKEEDYAFFWDSTVNKYHAMKDCDLMEIGPRFSPKGFGIGVPPGATYREELTMAILRLSDQGRLQELKTKYWGARTCPDLSKPSTDETSELGIENVAGVFFILGGGIIIATVVCLVEYVARKLCASQQDSQTTPKQPDPHGTSNPHHLTSSC
ncbi:glutamate receptor ionotropic, kainate 2-like isoform X1 [Babylonia areolata]|uniref:glutamate receptor ionotropic, kainate 2-like isoform X1 n=1 Tax=Babylonia areolata TaxID=304850 RepID=UPI003FD06EA0